MPDVPVVLFVYRRPDVLQQVLECLKANQIPTLHVFSDGPRDPSVEDEVHEVRRQIRAIDWCHWTLDESPTNRGLGESVRRGVTRVLQTCPAAIVFEDDLACVPGTYRYLASALKYYEDRPEVMSVTAWTHPRIVPRDVHENPYFDGKGECWAWGTWRRAWEGMNQPAMEIMRECAAAGLDIEKYGTDMPKMAAEAEKRNLWAIGWWYHILRRGGLCLRPPWSMVEQICWEEERSTTTTPSMSAWQNPPLASCPPVPTSWPEPREHPECARLWKAAVDGGVAD